MCYKIICGFKLNLDIATIAAIYSYGMLKRVAELMKIFPYMCIFHIICDRICEKGSYTRNYKY